MKIWISATCKTLTPNLYLLFLVPLAETIIVCCPQGGASMQVVVEVERGHAALFHSHAQDIRR